MIPKIERLRAAILLLTTMIFALPSWGVLSEYDLDRTLISLSADMAALQKNIHKDIRRFENRQAEFRNEIEHLDETCDETGIMLFSQDERYLYGTLQATQGMKDVIRRIRSQKEQLTRLESDLSIITYRYVAWANTFFIALCGLLTTIGYTILGSLLFLLWIGLVTGIISFELVKTFIDKKKLAKESVAGLTVRQLLYPLAIPTILLAAILWVSHIYNFTSWFIDLMNDPFVNMPDKIGVISASKILYIYALGVLVNYGLTLTKSILRRDSSNRQGQVAVWISVGNIIVWLCYAIGVILILDINKAGLIAAVGGASVGIGCALKNTFENFFSGLSLMTGRLRPGDILEYEGVRGKVLDIGIISTRMETEDGPIMAMPNRQLFEKNFKNMTRNHSVELRHILFDISSDNDPRLVRKIILDAFPDIDGVDQTRRHVVNLQNFGSGIMRVELKVWIDSEKYLATEPAVREAIFNAFRANGIQAATFLQLIDSKSTDSFMTGRKPQ